MDAPWEKHPRGLFSSAKLKLGGQRRAAEGYGGGSGRGGSDGNSGGGGDQ